MRKKTHEEYVNELKDKNPKIEVVGKYVGANINIEHKCRDCGHIWYPKPSLILFGFGCPECNRRKMLKSHEQYVEEVKNINPDIIVVGKYVNCETKILHMCKKEGHQWYVTPSDILQGHKCPICQNHVKLTQDDFVERMKKINPNIQVLGSYIDSDSPVKVKCLKDGFIWSPLATNLLHAKKGCPVCKESHGEREVRQYLKDHNIYFDSQRRFEGCKDKKALPFDFYIPGYNICIEYDGIQHFKSSELFGGEEYLLETQKHDLIKNEYCLDNNITLLRIKYDQNVNDVLDEFFIQYKIN